MNNSPPPKKNKNVNSDNLETNNSFPKFTSNHIFIGKNSVEKQRKTIQSTLFSNMTLKRTFDDTTINKNSNQNNGMNNTNNGINNEMNNGMNFKTRKLNENTKKNNNNENEIVIDNDISIIEIKKENEGKNKRIREKNKQLPLAELARPKTLNEFFGQEELIGENSILKSLIDDNKIPSLIFWGPPGVGKTCLARIIANNCDTFFREISGTSHGVADLKKVSEECASYHKITGKKPIFFVDEIHRFNKLQQDFFLPLVERGDYILIGATTENPSFKVNSALLSRCRVFTLKKLEVKSMVKILARASKIKLELFEKEFELIEKKIKTENIEISENSVENEKLEKKIKLELGTELDLESETESKVESEFETESELKSENGQNEKSDSINNENNKNDNIIKVEEEILELIAIMSDGDARSALNILDMAIDSVLASKKKIVSKEIIKKAFQKSHLLYDRNGEEHYNLISAFHKSVRGSDDNAALYWLGRMIYAGEDPLYIARRMIRIASEDVGLADSYALTMANSCYQACQSIGMPECDVILAHTAVYLSRAPKSVEVYMALGMVKDTITSEVAHNVPLHLRNAPTKLMKDLGYSKGYKYNPEYEVPVEQEYLPKELKCRKFLGVFEEERKKRYEKSLIENTEL